MNVFLSPRCFSLPLSLSEINENISLGKDLKILYNKSFNLGIRMPLMGQREYLLAILE